MNMPGHLARQFISCLLRGSFRIHPHDIFCAAGPHKSAPCAQNNPLSCLHSMNTSQKSPEKLPSTPKRPSLQPSSAWPCNCIRDRRLGEKHMRSCKTAGSFFQAGHNTESCMGGPVDRNSHIRVSRPMEGKRGVCKVCAPEGSARTASSMRLCSPCGVTARVSASAVVTTDLSCTFTCRAAGPSGVRAVHHLVLDLHLSTEMPHLQPHQNACCMVHAPLGQRAAMRRDLYGVVAFLDRGTPSVACWAGHRRG